jgi:TetR/AcrR family transcriptional regulator
LDNIANTHSTEQRILTAASNIFTKQGMVGARMQDIANEAGINKAMLHYYFRSKEKLFEVVFQDAMGKLMSRINTIFTSESPLFSKIEMFCRQYTETVIENPYIPLFIIHELNRDPQKFVESIWQDNKTPPLKIMMEQISTEIKRGTIKPIDPFQLVLNMMSLCIFPFVGKPILQHVTGMNNEEYLQMLELRKTQVSQFIIDSIKA